MTQTPVPVFTPTPWATSQATPFINMPDNLGAWSIAPDAVQTWNQIPAELTTSLQAIFLIIIIVFGSFLLIGLVRILASSETGEKLEQQTTLTDPHPQQQRRRRR